MAKLLLYCGKQPHKLFKPAKGFVLSDFELGDFFKEKILLNGKIVAECEFKVEPLERIGNNIRYAGVEDGEWLNEDYYEYKSCLGEGELFNYVKDKFYAINIENLNIFDEPREIYECCVKPYNQMSPIININGIKKVWYLGNNKNEYEDYIAISVKPEELCRILNKEQTIIIRNKVLKEMIK